MNKKSQLSIIYVVLLSIFIGGAILYSMPINKIKYGSRDIKDDSINNIITKNKQLSVNAYKNELLKSEAIIVRNNNADINLHANLVEDKSGQVSLQLEYKEKGKLITKAIDTADITEIRNIFRFRDKYGNGYKLNNMVLNQKNNKLYFYIEGKQDRKYTHTTIYSYDFKNTQTEKVFYDLGSFNDFSVSPNEMNSAFSYLSCPQDISNNERRTIVIMRCSDNKLLLNSCEDIRIKQYESANDIFVYSYDFIKWCNNNICELRQKIKAKDNSQEIKERTIFYDVISNTLSDQV